VEIYGLPWEWLANAAVRGRARTSYDIMRLEMFVKMGLWRRFRIRNMMREKRNITRRLRKSIKNFDRICA
jgi:hypothetical protein